MHTAVKHALHGLAKALQNAPRRGGRQTPASAARARLAASCAALALCLAAAAAPGIDFRWKPDPARADPVEFDLYRGETARLLPDFGCTNIVAEALCWQTNGMGSAWWTVPGSTFAPSNDVGAARYRFFVKATDGTVVYRANGVIRMLGSPGAAPNELPLPVRVLDFAGVAVTNAPWTAEIAAATNAIPAPDLSAYLRKDGDTMTGTLNVPWVHLAQGTVKLDLDPIEMRFENGTAVGRNKIKLYDQNGDRVEITPSYGFELIRAGQQYGDIFGWPSKMGTLALLEDIPPAPAPTPVYADPAPWSLSSSMVAPRSAADTYCVTNGDTIAEYVRQGSYTDAQFAVGIEDRPAEYAYEAPTGTWSIVSDPQGAASGISPDGYLSSSRTNSGSVVVEYATPTNGTKTASVFLAQSVRDVKVRNGIDFTGTFRWTCGTNVLAVYDAVGYSGPYHTTTNPYSTGETEKILDALCPYDTFGRSIPTASNPAFCWRGLMPNLLCVSVQKTEQMGIRGQQILAVSPHFAVAAKHFGEVPPSAWTEVFCTDYEAGAFVQVHCTNPRIGNHANDIALIHFAEALPPQCIARLLRPEDAERLSPSLFEGAVGINYTQHCSIVPFHVGNVYAPWTIPGYDNATNAVHVGHVSDSGHAYGMVTPRLQFIPLGCLTTPNGGPSLIDADNQQWIAAQLARYGEEPTYWTLEELTDE